MASNTIGNIHYFSGTTDGAPPCVIPYSIQTDHRSNLEHVHVSMTIEDIRDKENRFDLDTNAFEILKYDGSIQDEFQSGSPAQETYYREISDCLQKRLNASKVIVYNYAFRSRGLLQPDEPHDDNHREPACYPHVDIAASAVYGLTKKLLGEEAAAKAINKRVQVINVWRPLGPNSITHKPLTICDYCTVNADTDVHEYTVRGATLHAAGYLMSRSIDDTHRWYYLSQMQSNEMFAFKMADTKTGVARFACHTAFVNENVPIPDVVQKSVEVRCLVLYDE